MSKKFEVVVDDDRVTVIVGDKSIIYTEVLGEIRKVAPHMRLGPDTVKWVFPGTLNYALKELRHSLRQLRQAIVIAFFEDWDAVVRVFRCIGRALIAWIRAARRDRVTCKKFGDVFKDHDPCSRAKNGSDLPISHDALKSEQERIIMPELHDDQYELDQETQARRTDPDTSQEAASKASQSRAARVQMRLCIEGTLRWPKKTAPELHALIKKAYPGIVGSFAGEDSGNFAYRQLYKLRDRGWEVGKEKKFLRNGPARPCTVSRGHPKCITWIHPDTPDTLF